MIDEFLKKYKKRPGGQPGRFFCARFFGAAVFLCACCGHRPPPVSNEKTRRGAAFSTLLRAFVGPLPGCARKCLIIKHLGAQPELALCRLEIFLFPAFRPRICYDLLCKIIADPSQVFYAAEYCGQSSLSVPASEFIIEDCVFKKRLACVNSERW